MTPADRLLVGLGLLGACALGILIGTPMGPQISVANLTPENFDLCVTEDSDNCYWDAQVQGNGSGRSFYAINGLVIIDYRDSNR